MSLAIKGGEFFLAFRKNRAITIENPYKSEADCFNKVLKGLVKPRDTKKLKEFKRKNLREHRAVVA